MRSPKDALESRDPGFLDMEMLHQQPQFASTLANGLAVLGCFIDEKYIPLRAIPDVRVVVLGVAHGPRVLAGQIDQFALNLRRHQAHQAAR